MLEHMRAYLAEHRNGIFTLILVLLVDHVFLNGALKAKVKETLEEMLASCKKGVVEVRNEAAH